MFLKYNRVLVIVLIVGLSFPSVSKAQEEFNVDGSRNDFKFTLLSLGSGSTRITYERAINPLNSWEATVGLIGLG